LAETRKTAKLMLAWRSIRDDKALDLKDSQREDARQQSEQSASALEASVRRAWSQILVPVAARNEGEPFSLDKVTLRNTGGKSVAQAVWDRVSADGQVLEKLGRMTLSDRLAENWPADADHMPVATIRDWFVQYVRFDRLRDEIVLGEALTELVRDALSDFAYADRIGGDATYIGLVSGKVVTMRFDGDAVLVRRAAADAQTRATASSTTSGTPGTHIDPAVPSPSTGGHVNEPTAARTLRRFYGSVELDTARPVRDLQPIIDSVISELMRTDGVRVTLRLEIEATASGGFATEDAAVVRDNAKTLKFRPDATGFAED
jgi:hypothetical protein